MGKEKKHVNIVHCYTPRYKINTYFITSSLDFFKERDTSSLLFR